MRNLNPKTLKKILLVLLGVVVLAIIVNLLSNELETILRAQLGDDYLTALLIAGGGILVLYLYLEVSRDRTSKDELEDLQALREELLAGTLKRYQSRRKQKLNNDLTFEINIELAYVETKTNDPVHQAFTFPPEDDRITEYQTFFKSFYQGRKRLLILGEPGSGKTLLLVRMGESLIEKAKEDPAHPVPIIINLAGWGAEEESFEEWMTGQLVYSAGEAGISRAYAKGLVDEHQVLPLLDGFDEVPEDYRESCLEALEEYLKRKQNKIGNTKNDYPEVIICSRKKEFYGTEKPVPVYATAVIQPLTPVVVENTLETLVARNNLAAGALSIDFKRQKTLQEALQTAFFVHTALSLYTVDWKPDAERYAGKPVETVQNEMVQAYLGQEFKRLEKKPAYLAKKTRHWLSWLAYRLEISKKGVSFELADMQPEWLGTRKLDKWLFLLVGVIEVWLILCLIGITTTNFLFSLNFNYFTILEWALEFLVICILISSVALLDKSKITITFYDNVVWDLSLQNFAISLRKSISIFLISTFALSLYFGLFFKSLSSGVSAGASIGFAVSFGYLFIFSLKRFNNFPRVDRPYQRILSNLPGTVTQSVLIFLLLLLIPKLLPMDTEFNRIFADSSLSSILISGIIVGVGFGIVWDNISKFLILYLLLFLRGNIPFRFVRFLNQTAEHTGLLERDGGQWRFRHDLLQRALAAEWEEKEGK